MRYDFANGLVLWAALALAIVQSGCEQQLVGVGSGAGPPGAGVGGEDASVPRRETPAASAAPIDATLGGRRIVDLTYSFDEKTIYWPTEDGFRLERGTAGFTEAGYYYAANRFFAPEHGGTHIDAPIHFYKDHLTVDQLPLDRLIGEGVVVDVRQHAIDDPDYQVDVGDLRGWEEKHGRVLADVILLLRTGHGRFWPDPKRYLGTDAKGREAVSQLHFPGLHPDAAGWLVEHRAVKAVGIDTPSIDCGPSTRFETHVKLFEHNVPALENVANLEQLPEVGMMIVALPMKIAGGSGGPTRVIAILP